MSVLNSAPMNFVKTLINQSFFSEIKEQVFAELRHPIKTPGILQITGE